LGSEHYQSFDNKANLFISLLYSHYYQKASINPIHPQIIASYGYFNYL